MSYDACRMRAAISGAADNRCTSSNAATSGPVASGMNSVVKTRRNAGFGRPQPTRVIETSSSSSSCAAAERPARRVRPRA